MMKRGKDLREELLHKGTLYSFLGHIRGKVVDIDGCGVGGCKMWIRENGQSAYSDAFGNFSMINIRPGLYTIIIECEGFSPFVIADLPVEPGDNPGHLFTIHSLKPSGKLRHFNLPDPLMVTA
jgi:hypothetical protein